MRQLFIPIGTRWALMSGWEAMFEKWKLEMSVYEAEFRRGIGNDNADFTSSLPHTFPVSYYALHIHDGQRVGLQPAYKTTPLYILQSAVDRHMDNANLFTPLCIARKTFST